MLELFDVVVVSYESFLLNQDDFCKESWTCVVLDEAQAIKNRRAQVAEAIKKLSKAPFRLAITGTPIENSLEDLHSILQFVQPDCAGSVQAFRQRFTSTEQGNALLRKLVPFIALRRESGVAVKMVAKEETEVPVALVDIQRSLYDCALGQQSPVCKRLKDAELVCTHPWCYATRASAEVRSGLPQHLLGEAADQKISDSGKLEELFKILRGLLRCRQKVLVFFCRTITSDLVAALINREFGTEPGIIRGDTSGSERDRLIREFRTDPDIGAPHCQVLLLSVWVGAQGLNLPEARWAVHLERVWNPALERQATSRVHRITSKLPVKAYCLFTENTVEEHKRSVLVQKHKLSTHIIDSLDGDDEEEGEEFAGASSELHEVITGLASGRVQARGGDVCSDDDIMATPGDEQEALGEDEESQDEPEETVSDQGREKLRRDQSLHPSFEGLKPRTFKQPMKGKYGDPSDKQLWDWYVNQGQKEIHPKAFECSTAPLAKKIKERQAEGYHAASKFSSAPSRVHDPRLREDWEVKVDLGGTTCRLFIPSGQRKFFETSGDGLRISAPKQGVLPFPIFMPSSSRSAMDAEVGMLDLTGTMVRENNDSLEYLQIVAVRPTEVEKYRASGPFFVVMELPCSQTCEHPHYGALPPEKLGIGSSRHWLMRLADALKTKYVFMMDDSVRAWRGVTLIGDQHSLFGHVPGKKAQFANVPLGQVLEHFAEPTFLSEEMPKCSVLGFGRFSPDLYRAKCAYRRGHVYSAFLLNVPKVLHEHGMNFNENLFVWEDLDFNLRVNDVCKCFRFVMIKKPYSSGGCSSHIARTENPYVRAPMLAKFSPEEIASEVMDNKSLGYGVQKSRITVSKRSKKGVHGVVETEADDTAKEELKERSVYELENDPSLQAEGAVLDEKGRLLRSYYKRFVEPFAEKERNCVQLTTGTVNLRPGMREKEDWPDCLRVWDDTRAGNAMKRKSKMKAKAADRSWGAGWIADNPFSGKGLCSSWFNVKAWKTWRLCFLLARLQMVVWQTAAAEKGLSLPAGPRDQNAGAADGKTPVKRRRRRFEAAKRSTPLKRKRGRMQKVLAICDSAKNSTPVKRKRGASTAPKMLALCDQPATGTQPTLKSFFGHVPDAKKTPKVESPQQPTLRTFFKSSRSST